MMHAMHIRNKKEPLILFLGDVALFYLALWLSLTIRYQDIPSREIWGAHLAPFSILFVVWGCRFFIAGLYEKHTLVLKSRLPAIIFYAHAIGSAIAVSFFYLIPFFGIAPKTNLFIFLVLSFLFILAWRLQGVFLIGARKRQRAFLIGSGIEMEELYGEVNKNPRYNFQFVSFLNLGKIEGIDFEEEIVSRVYSEEISTIIIDMKNEKILPILPHLYNLIFSHVRFIDMHKVYEEVFDRVPLSLLGYSWFMENISSPSHLAYDALKRGMDIVLSFIGTLASFLVYPFVYIVIKLDDGGPMFITQERIGQGNRMFTALKFRSMKTNDAGVWPREGDARITRAGRILRMTRIDELPQLWNVLTGDMSLIGPRPDIIGLGKDLALKIPYYTVRNLIKPGLSGWAQIKQDAPPHSLEETRIRLSYDLYYIKNRSLLLDLNIALKTIRTLLSRTGR